LSKVDDTLLTDEYQAGSYLSLTEFLNYYGFSDTDIQTLNGATVTKYKDWVRNGNRTVETALYKYNDEIPIDKTSETFTYAKSMAMHWAQYEKAADEGAPNMKSKKELWSMDKQHIIETMKAQPQKTTQRVVTSSSFNTDTELYSQNLGQKDIF